MIYMNTRGDGTVCHEDHRISIGAFIFHVLATTNLIHHQHIADNTSRLVVSPPVRHAASAK